MDSFLDLHKLWKIIETGLIGELIRLVDMSIPDWILQLFNVPDSESLDGVGEVIYNIIYEVLDAIPFGNGGETFATLSMMTLMLGAGLLFVLVYSLAKWFIGIIT